ncbi:hypothetical protein RQP46_003955 [Phenoliferia psychrophenolica]
MRRSRRAVNLPTEVLLHICACVPSHDARERNRTLSAASLVSKAWHAAAHEEQYQNLVILWRSSSIPLLFRSFALNPALLARVRTLNATYTSHQQWLEEWEESVEGEKVRKEASIHWPYTEDNDAVMDVRYRFEDHRASAARVWAGDDTWIKDEDARQLGSEIFWVWVPQLSNLHTLTLTNFNQYFEFTPALSTMASRLRHFILNRGDEDDEDRGGNNELLSLLDGIESLDLTTTWNAPAVANQDLDTLKRLRLHVDDPNALSFLTVNQPPNLIALDLNLDISLFPQLPTPNHLRLPTLPLLASLCLRLVDGDLRADADGVYKIIDALGPTSLEHLRIDGWKVFVPTPKRLSRTLVSLVIDIPRPTPEVIASLNSILKWKDALPRLELVGLLRAGVWKDEDVLEVRAITNKAEGFRCVLETGGAVELCMNGQWWQNYW